MAERMSIQSSLINWTPMVRLHPLHPKDGHSVRGIDMVAHSGVGLLPMVNECYSSLMVIGMV